MTRNPHRRLVLAGLAALGASLWTRDAYAVVRDITITGGNDRPIPGADIIIRIPRKPRVVRRKRNRPRTVRRRPDRVVRRRTDRSGRARVALPVDIDCTRKVRLDIRVGRRRFMRRVDLCRRDVRISVSLAPRRGGTFTHRPGKFTPDIYGGDD